jgi:DNA polymerase-3 subunit epsilon
LFAIVDVETTGGHPSGHGMTEIAIVLYDGVKVVKDYTTLLNPKQNIPLNIQVLTGISNTMVEQAPTFAEKAAEIQNILADHVFVAHNVNFDYSFVKAAFGACGIDYNPKRLCSVRYARRVAKGLKSYSLGNLCKHFNITNEAAHRAWGDARATTQLMSHLFALDTAGEWQHLIKKNSGEFNLPANLPSEQYQALPETPGVYYFLDENHKPLYIGKAINLKKRVASHFISDKDTKKSQGFKREIYTIDFEQTGSELLASLLEDHEIRHHWPKYNLAQKKPKKKFGLFTYKSVSGHWNLVVNQLVKQQGFIAEFYSLREAKARAVELIEGYKLQPRFCGYTPLHFPLQADVKEDEHQENFERMLQDLEKAPQHMLIKTKGRTLDEDGFAYVQEGKLTGIGFVPKEVEISHESDVLPYVRSLRSSVTTQSIVDKVLSSGKYPTLIFDS